MRIAVVALGVQKTCVYIKTAGLRCAREKNVVRMRIGGPYCYRGPFLRVLIHACFLIVRGLL